MIHEKAKKTKRKKARSLELNGGGKINRVSGGGKKAWTVGFDRVSMFGSAEEEKEERPRLRVSSHKEVGLVSSEGNDDSQIDRFFFRRLIFDEHSWLGFSFKRRSLAEC